VAALALLSTLLVAVLTIKARVTRQAAHAQRRLEAVAAADRLLAGWWRDVKRLPRSGGGRVPGDAGLAWRTTPVANAPVNALAASVIRLEVIDARNQDMRGAVLASVEVVLDDAPARDTSPERQFARAARGEAP
jgi:hypothetical protein